MGQFGPTTTSTEVNLHLLTMDHVVNDTPLNQLPIEFTGSADQCEEYATDDDYVWQHTTKPEHPCCGFYFRKADLEMGREGTCLIPLPKGDKSMEFSQALGGESEHPDQEAKTPSNSLKLQLLQGTTQMDPKACLKRFLEACSDEDRNEAMEAIADLYTWMAQGGFPPEVVALKVDGKVDGTVFELPWTPAR